MVMATGTAQYQTGPSPQQVASPSPQQVPIGQNVQRKPFRGATIERTDQLDNKVYTMTTLDQLVEIQIPGRGYIYGLDIQYQGVTSGNSANVTFTEDGPYSSQTQVQFRDVNATLQDNDPWTQKQVSKYGGWELFNNESSADTLIWSKTTGTGGTGGSYNFHLRYPIALNRRNLWALQGNQDRSQTYWTRSNIPASGTIYGTAPTTLPNVTQVRTYESYIVPNATDALGNPQETYPPFFGIIPFITRSTSPQPPAGGGVANHILQRISTTVRLMVLILRSNGTRANAEANQPTLIVMKVGDQPFFNETPAYRRKLMYDRYGFDAPSGVYVYDLLHDFAAVAGAEYGNDWYWTQNLVQWEFDITYPSGFGTTNNSLVVCTSDMTIPNGMALYAE